jgi:hypothetical protein
MGVLGRQVYAAPSLASSGRSHPSTPAGVGPDPGPNRRVAVTSRPFDLAEPSVESLPLVPSWGCPVAAVAAVAVHVAILSALLYRHLWSGLWGHDARSQKLPRQARGHHAGHQQIDTGEGKVKGTPGVRWEGTQAYRPDEAGHAIGQEDEAGAAGQETHGEQNEPREEHNYPSPAPITRAVAGGLRWCVVRERGDPRRRRADAGHSVRGGEGAKHPLEGVPDEWHVDANFPPTWSTFVRPPARHCTLRRLPLNYEVVRSVRPDVLAVLEANELELRAHRCLFAFEAAMGLRGLLGLSPGGSHIALFLRRDLQPVALWTEIPPGNRRMELRLRAPSGVGRGTRRWTTAGSGCWSVRDTWTSSGGWRGPVLEVLMSDVIADARRSAPHRRAPRRRWGCSPEHRPRPGGGDRPGTARPSRATASVAAP